MIAFILIVIAFILQLTNLTLLPSFTDEANYIDWGWRATHLPGHVFYSLYDAKQPLVIWLFGLAQNFFSDPLFAARFVSVICGFLTALGVFLLAKKMFDENTAKFSLAIYLASHYFFFFNRQALVEAGLASIFIWTAYVLFALPFSLKQAIGLGALFGLGYLAKSNSLLVIFISIVIWFYKNRHQDFGKLIVYLLLQFTVAVVILAPMFMHPWFSKYIHLSTQYTFTISQLLKIPIGQWFNNISTTSSVLFWLYTPVTLIISIWGILKSKRLALAVWIFFPLIAQIILAKFLVSRYIVAYLPALVIFAGFIITKKRWLSLLILVPNLYLISLIVFSPPTYFRQLSKLTNYSYIEGYVTTEASGYNLTEARKYFDELAIKGPYLLGLAVFSGNPEAGLLIYYRDHPQVKVSYFDAMLFGDALKDIDCFKYDQPVYLASRDPAGAGLLNYFDKIHEITNSYNDSKIHVFKLKENCHGNTFDLYDQ